ncbi:MAG: hypothetical protein CM1200mP18_07130 [Gammaproteobacteria bacterium]|nr:MAG: hypothetical protein CM1200mP18_07130 [Gammaproteobacteria bacterium]
MLSSLSLEAGCLPILTGIRTGNISVAIFQNDLAATNAPFALSEKWPVVSVPRAGVPVQVRDTPKSPLEHATGASSACCGEAPWQNSLIITWVCPWG